MSPKKPDDSQVTIPADLFGEFIDLIKEDQRIRKEEQKLSAAQTQQIKCLTDTVSGHSEKIEALTLKMNTIETRDQVERKYTDEHTPIVANRYAVLIEMIRRPWAALILIAASLMSYVIYLAVS